MTTRPAAPTDWKTEPLPADRTTIALDRVFLPSDMDHIRAGHTAGPVPADRHLGLVAPEPALHLANPQPVYAEVAPRELMWLLQDPFGADAGNLVM